MKFHEFLEKKTDNQVFEEVSALVAEKEIDIAEVLDVCFENLIGETSDDETRSKLIELREDFWDKLGYGAGRVAGGIRNMGSNLSQGFQQGFGVGQGTAHQPQQTPANHIDNAKQAADAINQAYRYMGRIGLGNAFKKQVIGLIPYLSQVMRGKPLQFKGFNTDSGNSWKKGMANMQNQQTQQDYGFDPSKLPNMGQRQVAHTEPEGDVFMDHIVKKK